MLITGVADLLMSIQVCSTAERRRGPVQAPMPRSLMQVHTTPPSSCTVSLTAMLVPPRSGSVHHLDESMPFCRFSQSVLLSPKQNLRKAMAYWYYPRKQKRPFKEGLEWLFLWICSRHSWEVPSSGGKGPSVEHSTPSACYMGYP